MKVQISTQVGWNIPQADGVKSRASVVAKYDLAACLKYKLAWLSGLMNARQRN